MHRLLVGSHEKFQFDPDVWPAIVDIYVYKYI